MGYIGHPVKLVTKMEMELDSEKPGQQLPSGQQTPMQGAAE